MKVEIHVIQEEYQPLFAFVDKPGKVESAWEKENKGLIHRDIMSRLHMMSSNELKEMFDNENFEPLYTEILSEKELTPSEKAEITKSKKYDVSVKTIKKLWKEAEAIVLKQYGTLKNFYGVVTKIFKNKINAYKEENV